MLIGKELGAAIEAARRLKGVTKKALAAHFGVSTPAVQDWVNRGTIKKDKLPLLWEYFGDVVGPEHWGLAAYPYGATRRDAPPDPETILEWLGMLLRTIPEAHRVPFADNLAAFARERGSDVYRGILLTLLTEPERKHKTAA